MLTLKNAYYALKTLDAIIKSIDRGKGFGQLAYLMFKAETMLKILNGLKSIG